MGRPKKETAEYKEPHISVIEWISYLTIEKKPWNQIPKDAQKKMDKFIINKFLSMDLYLLEAINNLQKDMIGMDNDEFYRVYLELLPQQKFYFKYIKAKDDEDIPPQDINIFIKYFSVSRDLATEYYRTLQMTEKGKEKIKRIKRNYQYEFKLKKEEYE